MRICGYADIRICGYADMRIRGNSVKSDEVIGFCCMLEQFCCSHHFEKLSIFSLLSRSILKSVIVAVCKGYKLTKLIKILF